MELNLNNGTEQSVKVYLRNSQKYAKVINISKQISGEDLYSQVSDIFHLLIDQVHLYFEGTLIKRSSELHFEDKSIIHIVNLLGVRRDSITINVKKLKGRINPVKLEVSSLMKIRNFIDEKLYKVYGEKSDKIFLVYLGKQLNLQRTFMQEDVEDGSQMLCLQLEDKEDSLKQNVKNDDNYIVRVKDLQTPEVPKDIYPLPNFAIKIPRSANQTNNHLNLIFDPKIKHASSINNIELDPQEIIPEAQQTISDYKKNTSYHSECLPENDNNSKGNESHMSEQFTSHKVTQKGSHQEGSEKSQRKSNQQGGLNLQTGDFIYAEDMSLFPNNDFMGDLLQDSKRLQTYQNTNINPIKEEK